MKKARLLVALALAVALPVGPAAASFASLESSSRDGLEVRDAWVAEAMPGTDMSAAYLVIANSSEADEELVSVESDVAEAVELHKMEHRDGMMRMVRVESITVVAGSEVELKPGGLHIMLIGLTRQIEEGDMVELSLEFESGATLEVSAPVKKR